MPEPKPRQRWLLARSRRKARRRHARETHEIVRAVTAGLVLDPWQRRLLALVIGGERSHD